MTKIINTNTSYKLKERRVEDFLVIEKINEIFKRKRGYIVALPDKKTPVVACISGGLDSICNINILLEEFNLEIYPFFINRSQTNYKYEKKAVNYFNKYFKRKYPKLYHHYIEIYAEVPGKSYKDLLRKTKRMKDNKQMRHDIAYPSRNPIMFLLGAEYAYSLNAKGIKIRDIFGAYISSDDLFHSSLTSVRTTNLMICQIMGDYSWQFISLPIEEEFDNCWDKDRYVKYSVEKEVPLEKTRSCVKNTKIQCGRCPSCWERRKAFIEANYSDKTKYLYPMPKELPSY